MKKNILLALFLMMPLQTYGSTPPAQNRAITYTLKKVDFSSINKKKTVQAIDSIKKKWGGARILGLLSVTAPLTVLWSTLFLLSIVKVNNAYDIHHNHNMGSFFTKGYKGIFNFYRSYKDTPVKEFLTKKRVFVVTAKNTSLVRQTINIGSPDVTAALKSHAISKAETAGHIYNEISGTRNAAIFLSVLASLIGTAAATFSAHEAMDLNEHGVVPSLISAGIPIAMLLLISRVLAPIAYRSKKLKTLISQSTGKAHFAYSDKKITLKPGEEYSWVIQETNSSAA